MVPAFVPRSRSSAGSRRVEPSRRRETADRAVAAILDAAEEVALREGFGKLSLQAVAREVGLSKGGLLHHFPSKDALIDALVRRVVDGWVADTEEAIAATGAGPGRLPRACIGMCLSSTGAFTETIRRSSVVLLAALLHDRRHVEPLREAHRALAARVGRDGLRPGVGEAVQLAIDGFWFNRIFELTEWSGPRLAAVRRALEGFIEAGASESRRPARPRASSARRTGPGAG
jgi:AcrR family transcriptional regulator